MGDGFAGVGGEGELAEVEVAVELVEVDPDERKRGGEGAGGGEEGIEAGGGGEGAWVVGVEHAAGDALAGGGEGGVVALAVFEDVDHDEVGFAVLAVEAVDIGGAMGVADAGLDQDAWGDGEVLGFVERVEVVGGEPGVDEAGEGFRWGEEVVGHHEGPAGAVVGFDHVLGAEVGPRDLGSAGVDGEEGDEEVGGGEAGDGFADGEFIDEGGEVFEVAVDFEPLDFFGEEGG